MSLWSRLSSRRCRAVLVCSALAFACDGGSKHGTHSTTPSPVAGDDAGPGLDAGMSPAHDAAVNERDGAVHLDAGGRNDAGARDASPGDVDAGRTNDDAGTHVEHDAGTHVADAGTEPAPPPPWDGFTPTGPGYTITLHPDQTRGTWEGFGTSLAWWGQGIGGSAYEAQYADLFFTQKAVSFYQQTLPGLGLNIVRYNVGGGGRANDIADTKEQVPAELVWFKDIDGYEIDWNNHADPTSKSWDFTRDAQQRSILALALARGVSDVELFANAPMWWMTSEKSSAGGRLQAWNRGDFANYLATVTAHARSVWTGNARLSVEAFNEPTAGWWTYPKGQEGCNLNADEQTEILGALREGLDARNLKDVTIAGSDENTMLQAARTLGDLTVRSVKVAGQSVSPASLIGKINVHGYNGLDPWRDNNARTALHALIGSRRLWMSEYGDPDGSGMALAQTISEDLTYLKPTAWIYWQAAEPYSGWGLVNGSYADSPTQDNRGAPSWVYTKYFVFAQFTRFVRPGMAMLENDDHNTVSAFDGAAQKLSFVTVNYGNAQVITYDLSAFSGHGSVARVTYTETGGGHVFARFDAPIVDHRFQLPAAANSVYSVFIDQVVR